MSEIQKPASTTPGDIAIPRWLQIPLGVFFATVLVFCLVGSLMMVLIPNETAPFLAPTVGVVMTFVSLWGMGKSIRLVTGRRAKAAHI